MLLYLHNSNQIFKYESPVFILILIIGILFTSMTMYVFINVSTNQESLSEKKARIIKREQQLKKIASLYPSKNT